MSEVLHPIPLTAEAFAAFGDILDASGAPDKIINQGMCGRFHDRARLDFHDGRAGISFFNAQARRFPILLDMVERHPQGSQTFLPMTQNPFLVIVAADHNGKPDRPEVFLTRPGQGVNYLRGVWHGVLTPLSDPGLFGVIDRIGSGDNLQEYWFDRPYRIEAPKPA
jgi:ureidoglycolate lyase